MRVLFIGLYPPHIGGIATHTFNLKRELEKQGIKVYVLTYGRASGKRIRGTFVTKRLRGLSFLISASISGYLFARRKGIDLIHAHYLVPPGIVGVFLKLLLRKPLIVSAHGSDVYTHNSFLKFLSKLVFKFSDALISNSRATKERLKELGGKNIYVIYNGVDFEKFRPLNMKREAITYIGSLEPVKNLGFLFEALRGFDEKVWIVGDGSERKRLEELARELSLKVKFWGFRNDTCKILNKSKLLVLPSKFEGFGMVLLEAMACDTPVLGRRTFGISEILDSRNGILFESKGELRVGIENVLIDEKLRDSLIKNGRKTIKKFSWRESAKKVLEVYESLG